MNFLFETYFKLQFYQNPPLPSPENINIYQSETISKEISVKTFHAKFGVKNVVVGHMILFVFVIGFLTDSLWQTPCCATKQIS